MGSKFKGSNGVDSWLTNNMTNPRMQVGFARLEHLELLFLERLQKGISGLIPLTLFIPEKTYT